MLKRFIVENFLSFKTESILDLTASNYSDKHTYAFEDVKLLKSAIIYGANASGKSNLIESIEYARNIVLKSLSEVDTYKKYFRLDNNSLNLPSKFDFELEIENHFFSYGFSTILKDEKIVEEWLYKIGETTEMIFSRENNKIKLGKTLNNSPKDKFEIYAEDMLNQSNKLFLSEIANKRLDLREAEDINTIYDWFKNKLLLVYPDSSFAGKSFISRDKSLLNLFNKYLKQFDTGIIDIQSLEEDFENQDIPENIKKDIKKDLSKGGIISLKSKNGELLTVSLNDKDKLIIQKIGLLHGGENNDIFELKDESDGTKRLFDLIPLISNFRNDITIIIDEFDRSLHPMLTKRFFELFYKFKNVKSQLIITTHESTLLDLKLVRKDEIWFVKKDKTGSSTIKSLNSFKIRNENKLLEAYFLGRYDAIPNFKTFDEIDFEN